MMTSAMCRVPIRTALAFAVVVSLVLGLLLLSPPETRSPVGVVVSNGAIPSVTPPLEDGAISLSQGAGPAAGQALACAEAGSTDMQCSAADPAAVVPMAQTPHWTNLTGPVAPSPSDYTAMAFDSLDNYVVLFGGLSSTGYPLNDTWTFANGQWTNITATAGPAPVARYGMAMVYDPLDGYVLGFGGTSSTPCTAGGGTTTCNDTWSFAHGKWSAISTPPPKGYSGTPSPDMLSMVYDVADSYVLATDGVGTWRYSGGVWAPFCGTNCTNFIPGPGLEGSVAYDARDGYVLFFGAQACSCGVTYRTGSYTWKFSAGAWTNITASAGSPPPSRQDPAMTSDSSSGGVLLFGGIGNNGSNGALWLNDTWMFGNGSWNRVVTAPSPPGRYGAGVADDTIASAVVLFGGDAALGSVGDLNDTWIWGSNPPIGELSPTVVPSAPLPGVAATFNVSFQGGVPPFTYSWSFGDGTSSTLASPTHTFAATGYYAVQVRVNDSVGHSVNASMRVHVYTPLSVSSIHATPDPAVLGQPVNFTAHASGGTPPYTYSWAFGDGGTGGNLSNITHIYTTNGPFRAEVSATDAVGATVHAFLNVSIRLQALAGTSSTTGSAPLTVTFVGQGEGGSPPYSFDWNFGDGTPSTTSQNPSHTYNASGTFTVTLTVLDSAGNRSTSFLTLQVTQEGGGGLVGPGWFGGFVAALLAAAAIAATWGVVTIRHRQRRTEAEEWIEELTAEGKPPGEGPGP